MLIRSFLSFLSAIIISLNSSPEKGTQGISELPQCVMTSHCAFIHLQVSDLGSAFQKAGEIVENMPRTEILDKENLYIHAATKTKWMQYTDDLEIKGIPEKKSIQLRSESRVGLGDFGVNKKRIDHFADLLRDQV